MPRSLPDRRLAALAAGVLELGDARAALDALPFVAGAALRLARLRALIGGPQPLMVPGWAVVERTHPTLDGDQPARRSLHLRPPTEPGSWRPLLLRHGDIDSEVVYPRSAEDWSPLSAWRRDEAGHHVIDFLPTPDTRGWTVVLVPGDAGVPWAEPPGDRWADILTQAAAGRLPVVDLLAQPPGGTLATR